MKHLGKLLLIIIIALPAAHLTAEEPKAPAKTKAGMPFLDMLPADTPVAAISFRDISKLLADMRALFSRIPSLRAQGGMEEGFLDIFRPYGQRGVMSLNSFAEFENSGVATGSYATVSIILPPIAGKENASMSMTDMMRDSISISFFRPDNVEPLKKVIDACLKEQAESSGYNPWGEEEKEEKKGDITSTKYKDVEIRIAKSRSNSCVLAMILDGTAIYCSLWDGRKVLRAEAVFKQIIDASKGDIPSLASNKDFAGSISKLDPADNFTMWARMNPLMSFMSVGFGYPGNEPMEPEQPGKGKPAINLTEFVGVGFHGSEDGFTGTFAVKLPMDKMKGAFGTDAWSMAKYVPDEGLAIFASLDLDMEMSSAMVLKYLLAFDAEMKENLDQAIATLEQYSEKDTEKEVLPLLGRKAFFAFYGLGINEIPIFLAGIGTKDAKLLDLAKEAAGRIDPEKPMVKTETYRDREIVCLADMVYCCQHDKMLLVSMSAPLIKRAINCAAGKGVTFAEENEKFGETVKGAGFTAYFDGPTMFDAILSFQNSMRRPGQRVDNESLFLKVFRKTGGFATPDDFGLTGKMWLKPGPVYVPSEEEKKKAAEHGLKTEERYERQKMDDIKRLEDLEKKLDELEKATPPKPGKKIKIKVKDDGTIVTEEEEEVIAPAPNKPAKK